MLHKYKMNRIKVVKGQILQQRGDLNSKVYMVETGLLRSYSIDEKGKEHVFMFAPENWTIAGASKPENPSDLFIDALEDSVIIAHDKKIENETNPQLLLNRITVLQKRVIMLMSSSALERYEHFVETYTDIVQRVPQRLIASYLGISPEALSRVRKELKLKK